MSDAMSNYIYYKTVDWESNKNALSNAFSTKNIAQAYRENAKRLESNLNLDNLPDDFVKDIQEALEFKKDASSITSTSLDSLFQEVSKFVSSDLMNYMLYTNGLKVGQYKKLGNVTLTLEQFHETLATLQKILDQIDKFDQGFQSIDKMGYSTVAMINHTKMEETKKAYNKVKNFIAKYSSATNMANLGPNINKKLESTVSSLVSNVKGGLYEYADYIHSLAVASVMEAVEAETKITGAKLTGPDTNYINDVTLQNALGQDKFSAKSDNVVTVMTYNKNEISMKVQVGISDKSYIEDTASNKSIASGVRWQATMYSGGLSESAFEYYYANLFIHEPDKIINGDSIYNRYLAAKASAFLISGIEGGTIPQAYFIRYGDNIVYVPKLLKSIADQSASLFKITPDKVNNVQNTFVGDENNYNKTDAYIRTKNTMSALRQTKFNAKR